MKNMFILSVLLLVGCDDATANKPGAFSEYTVDTKETVILYLDELTFVEAFELEHRAKGEGATFWWRGSEYTTDLAEDLSLYNSIVDRGIAGGWVTNNDDPDDNCYSNRIDECGVCDGLGKIAWFRDKDGDGLGTHLESVKSCNYPSADAVANK